ncbi:MAG: hypothetical protein K1X83_00945 [Oligoflexia bacterium]|nr:hypothetical protein [Oligoflexia bacterium]
MSRRIVIITVLSLQLFTRAFAFAIEGSDEISVEGYPVKQYLAVVTGAESELFPADLERLEGRFKVIAHNGRIPEGALVAAVVQMPDGAIVSAPLHAFGADDLKLVSGQGPQTREIEIEVETAQTRLKQLEQQVRDETSKLREAAGLHEVDQLTRQAEDLDRRISQLRELSVKPENR